MQGATITLRLVAAGLAASKMPWRSYSGQTAWFICGAGQGAQSHNPLQIKVRLHAFLYIYIF